jgi:hypothetical protein
MKTLGPMPLIALAALLSLGAAPSAARGGENQQARAL